MPDINLNHCVWYISFVGHLAGHPFCHGTNYFVSTWLRIPRGTQSIIYYTMNLYDKSDVFVLNYKEIEDVTWLTFNQEREKSQL